MSKGKLLIMGSSDYIKKTFGIGYSLIIFPKFKKNEEFLNVKDEIQSLVLEKIPKCENQSVTKDLLVYGLAYNEIDKFPELFEAIEKIKEQNECFDVNSEL